MSNVRRRSRARSGLTREQRAELDDLHRDVVMMRAGAALFTDRGAKQWWGLCERCGTKPGARPKWLQVAHVEPKGRCPHLRWDTANARALCVGCHLYWWHKGGTEPELWIRGVMGAVARELLALRARVVPRQAPDFRLLRLRLIGEAVRLRQARRAQ